jgi:hypothetical protein
MFKSLSELSPFFSICYLPPADFSCERMKLGGVKKVAHANYLVTPIPFDRALLSNVELKSNFSLTHDLPQHPTSDR